MNHFQRQSSDDWQEGVRFENRLRKIERDLEELKQKIYWFYVILAGVGLLVLGLFIKR